MLRPTSVVLLLIVAAAASGWCQTDAAKAAAEAQCDLPADLVTPDMGLPHVAEAMAKHGQVQILAIGSGSTVGDTTGKGLVRETPPQSSFPYRMVEVLQQARPAIGFHLTVKGGRNMTAEEMLPLLQRELGVQRYDLIVWQTGTVEAVRGLRPEAMRDAMRDGIEAALAGGADVIVVDPEFSRFLRANTDLGPYENTLQQIATVTGVTLFHRFDLTHVWASSGDIDLERVSRDARDGTINELNVCLGRALAKFVLTGAEEQSH